MLSEHDGYSCSTNQYSLIECKRYTIESMREKNNNNSGNYNPIKQVYEQKSQQDVG